MDIDITLGRNTLDNLSVKASAFSTLVATGELATIDCLELSGLTNKTREMVERGEQAKKKKQEDAIKLAKQTSDDSKDVQNDIEKTETK